MCGACHRSETHGNVRKGGETMPGNQAGRRRANAEGTIYFDDRRQRWRARYMLPNGQRPEVTAKTQRECRDRLARAVRARDSGAPETAGRQTLGEWLDYWLTHEAPARCRPGTLTDYRSMIRVHIVPALGRMRLVNLRPEHVQRLLTDLSRAGKSPATVIKVRSILRRALTRAMALGKVSQNVAALTDPPAATADPLMVPTPADVAALLTAFAGHELEPVVTVAVCTGVRRGELLGLAWGDLDLDGPGPARLHVRYQLQRQAGELRRVEPKTKGSRRAVALSALAIDALRRQRATQGRARLAAGAGWRDTGLVFTGAHGGPLDGESVYRRFLRRLAAVGLPPMKWHTLRHCYASLQAAEGATMQEVAADLGHADVRTTARYTHLFPDARQASAARIDRALGAAGTTTGA